MPILRFSASAIASGLPNDPEVKYREARFPVLIQSTGEILKF